MADRLTRGPIGRLKRQLILRREGTLTSGQKREISVILDEYARKLAEGESGDAQRHSELEYAAAFRPPTPVGQLLEVRHGELDDASEALVSAHAQYVIGSERADKYPAPDNSDRFGLEEDTRKSELEAIKAAWNELLSLRDSIEGQLALRRLMAPWLVVAVDVLVFVADFLLFWQTLLRVLDVPFDISWDAAIGTLASFFISIVGPSIVIVCSVAIARILAMKRAETVAERLGIGVGTLAQVNPSAMPGVTGTATLPGRRRWWSWLGWFKQSGLSLEKAAPPSWVGVLYLSTLLLTCVSLVYAVTFQSRLALAIDAGQGEFPAQLNILAVLIFALPAAAIVANVAGSNHLADILELAETKLESARAVWVKARARRMEYSDEILTTKMSLLREVEAVSITWEGAWDNLMTRLTATEEWIHDRYLAHSQERLRVLSIERGLNDSLSLYRDPSSGVSGSVRLVPDWEQGLRDDGIPHLAGYRELLEKHRPATRAPTLRLHHIPGTPATQGAPPPPP
jgi:hypothetical protein